MTDQIDLFSNHAILGKTDTSRAAAEHIEPVTGRLRLEVLDFITDMKGATNNEISNGTGIKLQTVCARRNELADAGAIRDSGIRRDGSSVWVPTA